ncbi:hypothetical protein C1645_744803 [Glomus cerebriforme]|uniref:Uncharacterized protein n=1 Tax=Glomus cerebriforme TaxID=658196 RepID=A0A397S3S3_9GLOM|nr:hypothetical protein C1645_744803 [Glomus cerebriforme]
MSYTTNVDQLQIPKLTEENLIMLNDLNPFCPQERVKEYLLKNVRKLGTDTNKERASSENSWTIVPSITSDVSYKKELFSDYTNNSNSAPSVYEANPAASLVRTSSTLNNDVKHLTISECKKKANSKKREYIYTLLMSDVICMLLNEYQMKTITSPYTIKKKLKTEEFIHLNNFDSLTKYK